MIADFSKSILHLTFLILLFSERTAPNWLFWIIDYFNGLMDIFFDFFDWINIDTKHSLSFKIALAHLRFNKLTALANLCNFFLFNSLGNFVPN